jgi:hypothetical protein
VSPNNALNERLRELVKLLRKYPPLTTRNGRDAWLTNLPDSVRSLITRRHEHCETDLRFIFDAVRDLQLKDGRWPVLILIEAVLPDAEELVFGGHLRAVRDEIAVCLDYVHKPYLAPSEPEFIRTLVNKTPAYSRPYALGHQQELKRATEFVENVKAGIATYLLLNFFALAGFGKTALLEQVWARYERVLPASFVRVNSFRREDAPFALCGLLIQIIEQLGLRLPRRIVELPPDYKDSKDEFWLADLLVKLVSGAGEFEKATLLLLDDYDVIPREARRWLEERVLGQLVKTRKTAIILTSESELRFSQFDLRMRLESCELSSLSAEVVSRALPEYAEFAPAIHRITGGLPIFTQGLIQQMEAAHIATAADFHSRERELLAKYYRIHVRETVLRDVVPDKRETILTLALLRRFDVAVLRGILPKVLPDYYPNDYGTAEYLSLIEDLGSWVRWRRQGGYALNEALRMGLQGYVLLENPGLYEQVNRAAVVFYREWLKKEYREPCLTELLYHELVLLRFENRSLSSSTQDEMAQARIGDVLLRYLESESIARIQERDLDSLRNSLLQDEDLKGYISEDVQREIRTLIDERGKKKGGVIPFTAESQ